MRTWFGFEKTMSPFWNCPYVFKFITEKFNYSKKLLDNKF